MGSTSTGIMAEFCVRDIRLGDKMESKTQLVLGDKVVAESVPLGFDQRLYERIFTTVKKAIEEAEPVLFPVGEMQEHVPAYVDVFSTTIAKHYRSPEDFHEGSIRVVKPEEGILVYLGCLKSDSWDGERCSPNPTVVKTIVPDTKKYRDELEHLKQVHPEVKINYQAEEVGVEPALSQDEQEELKAVDKALEKAEVRA